MALAGEHLQHAGADDARLRCDRIPAERDRRQDHVLYPAGAERGQPLQADGEDEDENEADPERRQGAPPQLGA